MNRLVQATHPTATNPPESFTYDPVGNRLSSQLATGQIHDAANRLLEDSNFTYAYDANGNLVEKIDKGSGERTVYTYDAENQLIGVDQFTVAGGGTPVLVADYKYDALGRRIEKNVNGVITRYVYDNEDIVFAVDGAGASQAFFFHGPGIDEPLAGTIRTQLGFQSFAYHADGLGSISTLTNASGTPVQTYTYDSFGQIVDQTGSAPNPYTYTARELDPETGLYYYRARYYDPSIGRFLQEDPFAGMLHLPQGLNRYPYVANNPTTLSDPNGKLVIADDIVLLTLALSAGAAIVLSDPEIQRITGQFLSKILEELDEKIKKGEPLTPDDIKRLETPPEGLQCIVETPSSFPGPPDPNDPFDPRFWNRPADWYKYTKFQKFRWFVAKIGIVVSRRFTPNP